SDDENDNDDDIGAIRSWYHDFDADGYGDPNDAWASQEAAEPDPSYVDNNEDCDDTNADLHPDTLWYLDEDDDGYGRLTNPVAWPEAVCLEPDPDYAPNMTDCVDTDEDINPETNWYLDDDEDGYGDENGNAWAGNPTCYDPSTVSDAYVVNNEDCRDDLGDVYPGQPELCGDGENNCDGTIDPVDSWWDGDWSYRIPVTVTAPTDDLASAPIAVEVDFGAALAAVGEQEAFDPDSVRVAIHDCGGLGTIELPSQYLDGWANLFDGGDSADPTDDDYGTVVFLYDEDGDISTTETFTGGSTFEVGIYFTNSAAVAPNYTAQSDLVTSATTLATTATTATFDNTKGGLLSALTYDTSPTLLSQTVVADGNGVRTGGNWIGPQSADAAGSDSLTLITDGPLFAAIEAAGDRAHNTNAEAYDYAYTYWMFARRDEVYVKPHMESTTAINLSETTDATEGIRPFQVDQDGLTGGGTATRTTDGSFAWADTSDSGFGFAWGYFAEPTYIIDVYNEDDGLYSEGNDYLDTGGGQATIIPQDTVFVDSPLMVILPHADAYVDVETTFQALLEGTSAVAGAAETP
ncbi:MAG: hypothetical protein HN348_10195, partial [Proteobacteria bacterium]|nr:hypothetical protein [Pseudomonadota bacterium]